MCEQIGQGNGIIADKGIAFTVLKGDGRFGIAAGNGELPAFAVLFFGLSVRMRGGGARLLCGGGIFGFCKAKSVKPVGLYGIGLAERAVQQHNFVSAAKVGKQVFVAGAIGERQCHIVGLQIGGALFQPEFSDGNAVALCKKQRAENTCCGNAGKKRSADDAERQNEMFLFHGIIVLFQFGSPSAAFSAAVCASLR